MKSIYTFSLEREEPNPFVKPSNKHGNNGYSKFQPGMRPMRWKEIAFIEGVTEEYAIRLWGVFAENERYRIVNWDTKEIL